MKHIKLFEAYSVHDYLTLSFTQEYEDLTDYLWENIIEEGFVEELENYYEIEYNKSDFEYIILNISNDDKNGLIDDDDDVINKFLMFDIELKKEQEPDYPTMVDFIDYDDGIVYIIRLI